MYHVPSDVVVLVNVKFVPVWMTVILAPGHDRTGRVGHGAEHRSSACRLPERIAAIQQG